ncbi:FHA domain-containing protein [Nocardioides sp.]|uniref:FHA domain-containing protein n=1 Tax=Nocardioides sp. TaxID=35761 RepID=UPI002ED482C7
MTETTATRSYRPGQWFGIFGSHATVLLPPSEKDRVGHLWALVDDGAGFDVVLDTLISDGLRDLPGFVLVSTEDDETKVVIRGAARAWFTAGDDTIEVAGSSATTWAERSMAGVESTRLVVEHDAPHDAPLLPIANGLVRVAEVLTPPVEAAAAEDDGPDTAPQPSLTALPDVGAAGPMPFETAAPSPPQAPPPPVGVPSGPPAPQPAVEHDGLTQGGPLTDPTQATPVPPVEPSLARGAHEPPVVAPPVARLVVSSGETIDVDRAVLVGRAPEARRFTSGDQPRLVTVASPAQEISSTHLEIRPGAGADHGSAVVTDLGSTNGTVVVQPGLPPEDLQPGIAVQLVPGAIIDLGDGVTIQVINP